MLVTLSFVFFNFLLKPDRKQQRPFTIGGTERVLQTVEQHPEILQQMLETVLNIVMFEDCRNQWSMSRPLLGLILLNEEVPTTLTFNKKNP